jgi:alkanesulfonate monooxygenase SsuD/methylene tetrahydromethanopterin reductase-like flavin-dependent oxidoreductase (luciferase family)
MFLGILGGSAAYWAQYARAYRAGWAEAGHPADGADIAVAVHGFVADNDKEAKATYFRARAAHARHRLRRDRPSAGGAHRAGGELRARRDGLRRWTQRGRRSHPPLHDLLGHSRQILQMDVGGLPHSTFLKAIELLGTEVLPQIRKELDRR